MLAAQSLQVLIESSPSKMHANLYMGFRLGKQGKRRIEDIILELLSDVPTGII